MASRSWNRVELIGNLTRDPELRYTPSGAAVASFGIATNRSYVVEGERKEEVDFHKLVAWNKLAELCSQLLKKGTRVFVSGRLQYREWEPQEGGKRRDAEIVLEDMIILTPKGDGGNEEYIEAKSEPKPQPEAEEASKEPEPSKEPESEPEPAEEAPTPKADEVVSEEDLPF